MIVRLSQPALRAIGGLCDESQQIYSHFDAEWRVQPMEWRFRNGAIIKFAAMPVDIKEVQGWQATNIIVDEGAEFKLTDILALNMTITCNPDRNRWLFPFVSYCLDENGVPKAGTEDITRYFVVRNGIILWGNSEDELFELHGKGLNRDPDKGRITFAPTSFRFIPMDIYSNPILLKNNPEYLNNLLSGKRVSQLRFLHGSWTAVPEGSSVFNRDWIKVVEFAPPEATQRVRSWDLAYSVPSESYPDPDWTAGVQMSRSKFGVYCIESVVRDRKLTDGVMKMIIDTANQDGLQQLVTFPKDNGGGKASSTFFQRMFSENGLHTRGIAISGQKSKMSRFLPFCSLAESGSVTIVKGEWNEAFLTELEHFDGSGNVKDDQVDACADAFNVLAKQTTLPDFYIPDMTTASPIPTLS